MSELNKLSLIGHKYHNVTSLNFCIYEITSLGWRVGSAVKNICCSVRGPEFAFQYPYMMPYIA